MISNFLFRKISKKHVVLLYINQVTQITFTIAIFYMLLKLNCHTDTDQKILDNILNDLKEQIMSQDNAATKFTARVQNVNIPTSSKNKTLNQFDRFITYNMFVLLVLLVCASYLLEYFIVLALYKKITYYFQKQLLQVNYTNHATEIVFHKMQTGLPYLMQAFYSEMVLCTKIVIYGSFLVTVSQQKKNDILAYILISLIILHICIFLNMKYKSKNTCDKPEQDTIYNSIDIKCIAIEENSYGLGASLCNENCHYNWRELVFNRIIHVVTFFVILLFANPMEHMNGLFVMTIVILFLLNIPYEDWLHGLIFYQYYQKLPKFTWGKKILDKPLNIIEVKNLSLSKTIDDITFTTIDNLNLTLKSNRFYALDGFNKLEWLYFADVLCGNVGPNSSIFFNHKIHNSLDPEVHDHTVSLHMHKKYNKNMTFKQYLKNIDPSLNNNQINQLVRLSGLNINIKHKIYLANSQEKAKFLLLELLVSMKRKQFIFISREVLETFDAEVIEFIQSTRQFSNFTLISNGDLSKIFPNIITFKIAI